MLHAIASLEGREALPLGLSVAQVGACFILIKVEKFVLPIVDITGRRQGPAQNYMQSYFKGNFNMWSGRLGEEFYEIPNSIYRTNI